MNEQISLLPCEGVSKQYLDSIDTSVESLGSQSSLKHIHLPKDTKVFCQLRTLPRAQPAHLFVLTIPTLAKAESCSKAD